MLTLSNFLCIELELGNFAGFAHSGFLPELVMLYASGQMNVAPKQKKKPVATFLQRSIVRHAFV